MAAPILEHVIEERPQADRLLIARLTGEAQYRARWRPLSKAEETAAVAALRELAGGRADLLRTDPVRRLGPCPRCWRLGWGLPDSAVDARGCYWGILNPWGRFVTPQARIRIAPPITSAAIVPISHRKHHADRKRKVIRARTSASLTSFGLRIIPSATLRPEMSKNHVTP